MYIEYECGCTSNKKVDNKRCGNHPWATIVKLVCEELGIYYTSSVL